MKSRCKSLWPCDNPAPASGVFVVRRASGAEISGRGGGVLRAARRFRVRFGGLGGLGTFSAGLCVVIALRTQGAGSMLLKGLMHNNYLPCVICEDREKVLLDKRYLREMMSSEPQPLKRIQV